MNEYKIFNHLFLGTAFKRELYQLIQSLFAFSPTKLCHCKHTKGLVVTIKTLSLKKYLQKAYALQLTEYAKQKFYLNAKFESAWVWPL